VSRFGAPVSGPGIVLSKEQEGEPSMDPRNASARAQPGGPDAGDPEAIDFVRFCYRRRRVGWPELYDEMCAVAGRGVYHGFCADDLGRIGIGFALDQMPALAVIVHQVVAEDQERRRLTAQAVRASYAAATFEDAPIAAEAEPIAEVSSLDAGASVDRTQAETVPTDVVAPRLVALAAGV
jgi:hypothetical protein